MVSTRVEKLVTPLRAALLTSVLLVAVGAGIAFRGWAAEGARLVPAPLLDEQAPAETSETAVLAGGCFWGVQGVFQHVADVTNAVSGYAGGDQKSAHYRIVGLGTTGHAESVRITFDPREISYGRILQIYFSVAHDPTQLNRQGPDVGTQYRSAIFPTSPEQARIAEAYIKQLNKAHVYSAAIVTKIELGQNFYAAEDYHQDYLTFHSTQPYIVYNDLPKIEALRELFPAIYRAQPVLVANTRSSN
jgi:peptide-methionine (S)-S-oxide reductase